MTKNRTPTPVYLDPGMHPGLEVKGLITSANKHAERTRACNWDIDTHWPEIEPDVRLIVSKNIIFYDNIKLLAEPPARPPCH